MRRQSPAKLSEGGTTNRHTLVTKFAESGTGDEAIRSIAG
jgi:hypothetical protein